MSRDAIVEVLVRALEGPLEVGACWEGGSAASGQKDQWSDLDLLVATTSIETVFSVVERTLTPFGILSQWRLPEPTWHGHSQCLYLLDEAPELFFVDLVVMDSATERRYFEVERHGKPVVYFDRIGFVREETADTESFRVSREQRQRQIRESLPFFEMTALKQMRRGDWVAAWGFYQKLLTNLVEVWGMVHRPWKYDFGMRYTQKDLPSALHTQLVQYCFVSQPAELEERIHAVCSDTRFALDRFEDRKRR